MAQLAYKLIIGNASDATSAPISPAIRRRGSHRSLVRMNIGTEIMRAEKPAVAAMKIANLPTPYPGCQRHVRNTVAPNSSTNPAEIAPPVPNLCPIPATAAAKNASQGIIVKLASRKSNIEKVTCQFPLAYSSCSDARRCSPSRVSAVSIVRRCVSPDSEYLISIRTGDGDIGKNMSRAASSSAGNVKGSAE